MIQNVLLVDPYRCTGCKLCELACSFFKEKEFSPTKSRIRIAVRSKEAICLPLVCLQCEKPYCVDACQVEGAILKDAQTGAIKINEGICIGCKLCMSACPYGYIAMHPEKRIPIKCDLCEGDPKCVKYCFTKAISWVTISKATIPTKEIPRNKFIALIRHHLENFSGALS